MDLVVTNLSKTYSNGVRALNDITLQIPKGMFGLLGPNGAGKSSLMRTIATLQEPDSGSIMLGDIDVLKQKEDVRKILGYLPQEFGLYPNLSAENILDHFAVLKGITNTKERNEQVKALLGRTNLYDVRKKNVGGYSGGMKQRLGIAIALLGNPKLIIVDEPTAGLDPTERYRFLNLLGEIGENIVVILSTHIVEDVRELCSNMAIIAKGNVLLSGTPDDVVNDLRGKIWKQRIEKSELAAMMQSHKVISANLVAGKPLVHVYADEQPGELFTQSEPNLEDVYFNEMHKAANKQQVEA
ncbi:MAG: ABC transporter ATP-binding protein [Candidatus Kapabacteria bacterium]|nr:ABC transporter ATP-binding protein [Candidatus Kapabacteria bacterium]